MVRATHGVGAGCWYYEIKIKPPLNEEDGHTRIGWCTDSGDVQAPVGYDVNSYAYRDSEGTKFHESQGHEYGEAYGPGDVIGCMLRMGEPIGIARERQRVSLKGQEFIVEEERTRVPSAGSSISFFKNGVPQGVAYSEAHAGRGEGAGRGRGQSSRVPRHARCGPRCTTRPPRCTRRPSQPSTLAPPSSARPPAAAPVLTRRVSRGV